MNKSGKMNNSFRWNPYADQPHNVLPKSKRFKQHLKYLDSYAYILISNLAKIGPGLKRYHKLRKYIFQNPVKISDPFALCFSPSNDQNEDICACFKELDIKQGLFRIPSWEINKLPLYDKTLDLFLSKGIDITIALLQQRSDVLDPTKWSNFLEIVFSRFQKKCRRFEIGHAWNRTKWGVWDYREYLKLIKPAVLLARKYDIQMIGPAVIDFEFHLYPVVLKAAPFDIISSLLYTDRVGAPENTQFGWDLSKKIALLRAAVDVCSDPQKELWVTEFNWPLKGTGKYSPVSGRPNVSEQEQSDYLARYYLLGSSSGYIQKIFWWQLIAPGYGLIDNRKKKWRKRPAYYAFKTLIAQLKDSTFTHRIHHPSANIFFFEKSGHSFASCWTNKAPSTFEFPSTIDYIITESGEKIIWKDQHINIDHSPKYIYFR
jgi:hypothetical protein